jgi:plastocyanin
VLAWLIRGILALAVLALVLSALGNRAPSPEQLPTPVVAEAPAPTVTPVPRPPTPTIEPFVERITSRISRATPAPFPTSTPLPNGVTRVSAVDFGYMPSVIRTHVGQVVLWRNDGREEHDITGDDWHSGALQPTFEYRQTFGYVGTFNYRCSIHPDMNGTIIVVPFISGWMLQR